MEIRIKKNYESTVVGFGNSGLPLGKRTDLLDLAIIAQKSQDPSLLLLFESLPSLPELLKYKVTEELKSNAPKKKIRRKEEE